MIDLLLYILILCLIAGLIWWAINQIPLPQPVRMVVVVLFVVVLVLILLSALPGAGHWPLLR